MSFRYKVNSRLLRQPTVLESTPDQLAVEVSPDPNNEDPKSPCPPLPAEREVVHFPLLRNPSRKASNNNNRSTVVRNDDAIHIPMSDVPQPDDDLDPDRRELQINIELDFGWIFGWMERIVWLSVFISVCWALFYNFEKATREVCYLEGDIEHYPRNILPSLSRAMSSFRVGKFIWTSIMAGVFVARLLSNHFLSRLYRSWYSDGWFNKGYLGCAYLLDTLEIFSLVMIPAFSLDCDPAEHSLFFKVFICLTYAAELAQYFTKFLKRKKGIVLNARDVDNYYTQIGILIILQTVFIAVMMTGYFLHDGLCKDYMWSIFTVGEYITVVINVRFKRDTVLFVK